MSDSTPRPPGLDWTAARGEKWLAQIAGMEAMLAPVDEPLLQALRLDAPHRIADVGCGGGATALAVLRRAPTGSVVHGYDISRPLVELARGRAVNERGIRFEVADMAELAPPSERYDRLLSRFGIMFFADPPAAFANLSRWLAPGGRFAFAAWGAPHDNPWLDTVREAVSEVVQLPTPDPEAPGPFRYGTAETLLTLLRHAGFSDVAVDEWRGVLPVGGGLSPAQAARFALAAFSNFSELLAPAGDAAREQITETLSARFAPQYRDGAVRMAATVQLFTGSRG